MSDPALLAPPGPHLPVVSHGEGVWLVDEAGRRYLDGSSGAVVSSLGHGNAEIAALQQQAITVAFAHRTQFRNRPAEELAAALVDLAPPPLTRAALLSSGSEANELAMKLAIRFWQEQGQPRKYGIISRWTSYHGSTLGALSATGHPARRRAFADLLHPFPRVAPPYCLRCPAGVSPESCAEACLNDLEVAIQREGPERLAASAHTYTNTPLPAAVGLAALEVMKRQDLVARASVLGVVLHKALASLSEEIEIIGDVRGLGLLQGVELVAYRQTLEPFNPELRVTARLVEAARHRGLLVYPAALGINGYSGDAIVVAPPLIISETEIGELVTRLREALLDVGRVLKEESSSVASAQDSDSREEE